MPCRRLPPSLPPPPPTKPDNTSSNLQEILWILKNAGLFGTEAGEVSQVIDSAAGKLLNVIDFPPDGAFVVDSDLSWVGDGRTDFKFNGASLKLPNRVIKLPPVGKGSFKSLFVGGTAGAGTLRLTKDSRGDLSIFKKK